MHPARFLRHRSRAGGQSTIFQMGGSRWSWAGGGGLAWGQHWAPRPLRQRKGKPGVLALDWNNRGTENYRRPAPIPASIPRPDRYATRAGTSYRRARGDRVYRARAMIEDVKEYSVHLRWSWRAAASPRRGIGGYSCKFTPAVPGCDACQVAKTRGQACALRWASRGGNRVLAGVCGTAKGTETAMTSLGGESLSSRVAR